MPKKKKRKQNTKTRRLNVGATSRGRPSKQKDCNKRKRRYHLPTKQKIIIAIIFLFIAMIETAIFFGPKITKTKKSDAIIVLGYTVEGTNPSSSLQSRIDKAYELYEEGYADAIIATGHKGFNKEISQAKCIYNELVKKGVPKKSILIEEKSINTYQNLKYADEIMARRGLDTAIVVSNYYHIYRALSIGKELDMELVASVAPMPNEIGLKIYTNIREIFSIIKFYITKNFY